MTLLASSGLALGLEHGADAVRRAAEAAPYLLETGGMRHVQRDAVVVGQLFAGGDVADGFDQHAVVLRRLALHRLLDPRLAVRVAAVVDPARRIAVAVAVDDEALVEGEQEGMAGLATVAILLVGLGMGDAIALVFDDLVAGLDGRGGEDAVSVDGGTSCGDTSGHREIEGVGDNR